MATQPVPFAKALYRMIKEHPDVISWDASTGSIVIPDPKALERTLLEYFRHGRYASFQRQLNNFGYRRVGSPGAATVYRRWAADGDGDLSLESVLSLRHVLRRSTPPQASKFPPFVARKQQPTFQPVQPAPPRYPPATYGMQQRAQPAPKMPPPRRLERFDSFNKIVNAPNLAAHALLSLKCQPTIQ